MESQVCAEMKPRVRSRVAWGAIAAGAFVTMGGFLLLGTLLGAIEATLDSTLNGSIAPRLQGSLILLAALPPFCGAWLASRLATGESVSDALLHAFILWSLIAILLVYFGMNGVFMFGTDILLGGTQEADELMPARPVQAAWWSVGGVLITVAATVLGALIGFYGESRAPVLRRQRTSLKGARGKHAPRFKAHAHVHDSV